jgi:hypothetical protein
VQLNRLRAISSIISDLLTSALAKAAVVPIGSSMFSEPCEAVSGTGKRSRRAVTALKVVVALGIDEAVGTLTRDRQRIEPAELEVRGVGACQYRIGAPADESFSNTRSLSEVVIFQLRKILRNCCR